MAGQFGDFVASQLYCPKCRTAQPVRERLLLVLPSGELHEYVCTRCATSLGKRTVTGPPPALQSAPALGHPRRSRRAPLRH